MHSKEIIVRNESIKIDRSNRYYNVDLTLKDDEWLQSDYIKGSCKYEAVRNFLDETGIKLEQVKKAKVFENMSINLLLDIIEDFEEMTKLDNQITFRQLDNFMIEHGFKTAVNKRGFLDYFQQECITYVYRDGSQIDVFYDLDEDYNYTREAFTIRVNSIEEN